MEESVFAQLLTLEGNLSKAEGALYQRSQTGLLIAQLERTSSYRHITEPHSVRYEDIEKLLKRTGDFNLTLCCNRCDQAFFENDKLAESNQPKSNLPDCCKKSLQNATHLDQWETSFWWFLINNFASCMLTFPHYTRFMVSNGIPPSLRDRVWGLLSLSNDSTGEVDGYMSTLYDSLNKDISPDIRIITKDVNRTFPQLSMFNDPTTKAKFERILNAYSIYDSDMGYCQGLQFIVAPMLFYFKNELKTFNSLVKLFDINNLRYIYDNQMSGLNLWFFQFTNIFSDQLPTLSNHFQSLDIDLKIFMSQWFLSFYSITIPFNFLIRMFDVMFVEGVKETLLRVGIVILSKNEDLLLSIDEPELILQHLLSENCWGVFNNKVNDFVSEVMSIPIESYSSESLKKLEVSYEKTIKSSELHNEKNNSFFEKVVGQFKSNAESIMSSYEAKSSSKTSSKSSLFSFKSNNNSAEYMADEDFELMEELYNLCIKNNIKDDPLLDRVKSRLYN